MPGFAGWLFGIAAQQPGEYRRLRRIRATIYTRVAPLRAEVVRSAEPIPFDELPRNAFRPLHPGQSWGGVLDCAWLRLTGEVPAGVEGAVVMLGLRGEGLLHDADGSILDGVTTVFQQGDLPHSGGRFRPVRRAHPAAGERVELYADVAHNGFSSTTSGRGSTAARTSRRATTRRSRSTTTT